MTVPTRVTGGSRRERPPAVAARVREPATGLRSVAGDRAAGRVRQQDRSRRPSSRHSKRFACPAVVLATLFALAVTAQPASAISLAFTQQRPALGFEPFDVRPGDVDGNGTTDLVLGEGTGAGVAVARGNGDGTFGTPFVSPPVTWSGGRIGFAELALGDVNADGRADVAVGTGGWDGLNKVQVMLGREDGTLSAARTFTTSQAGPPPNDVAIGDLNGDGNGDLVMPLWQGTTVAVLLSDGLGGFGAPADFPAGTRPTDIALADLNGDGKRDVVVTNNINTSEQDAVSVLLGNGDGTLAAPLSTPLFSVSGPHNMVAADLNGDGRHDVAIAHSTGSISEGLASVLFGNGDGTFHTVPRFRVRNVGTQGPLLATADFNRDGLGDLVVTGLDVSLQERQPYQFSDDGYDPQNPEGTLGAHLGNGLFGLPEIYSTPSGWRVTAADFDRDGWPDIAAIGEEGSARTQVLTVQLNRTASMPAVVLASLALDADNVPADSTSGGTVTLAAPAPPGGTIVELNSTSPCAIEFHGDVGCNRSPAPVMVPAGQTKARFSFRASGTATIIAQLGEVTKAARISVGSGSGGDFTLNASPASLKIVRGGASSSTAVTIAPGGGFSDPVTLTTSGVPAGVSVTPAGPVTVSPNASGTYPSTSLTFAATATVKTGSHTVTITATGGGVTNLTTLRLEVRRR
jgi:FG-GAP-like repeat